MSSKPSPHGAEKEKELRGSEKSICELTVIHGIMAEAPAMDLKMNKAGIDRATNSCRIKDHAEVFVLVLASVRVCLRNPPTPRTLGAPVL